MYYIYLTYFAKKPLAESNNDNTSIVIMTFYNVSLIMWIASITLIFVYNVKHEYWSSDPNKSCGPVAKGQNLSFNVIIYNYYMSIPLLSKPFKYLTHHAPAMCLFLLLLITNIAFKKNKELLIKEYVATYKRDILN